MPTPDTGPKPRTPLQQLREDANLTQQEVADRINALLGSGADGPVTDKAVSRWERGTLPSRRYQRHLAQVFGVTVNELGLTTRPTVDPLACLEETAAVAIDPRVTASQIEWRRTRAALNAHRRALTELAAATYPTVAQVADTGLIAGPGWVPDAPIPLAQVELAYDPHAPAPELDGTEPASAHVRPLHTLTRPYGRYTQAVRDLDHPKLFDNRASWRFLDLKWGDTGGRMTFGDCSYFAAVDVNEVVSHEIAYVALDAAGQPSGTAPRLRDLPYRRLLGDPFAFARRPLMPAISTLTIRAGATPSFILHRRDSRSVAMAGGMLQVIPSGIFQPSSVLPAAVAADFDLWRNIQREYAEELLGMPEHDGDGAPINYGAEPFATMDAARTADRFRVHCLGVALDALTLVGEILTVAVIDPDVFDDMARDFVTVNDEGTVINERLAFNEQVVAQVLASGRMAPAGAGCLLLAWRHRNLLLG